MAADLKKRLHPWLQKEVSRHAGKWVALTPQKVVAVGTSQAEVAAQAAEKGLNYAFTTLVPDDGQYLAIPGGGNTLSYHRSGHIYDPQSNKWLRAKTTPGTVATVSSATLLNAPACSRKSPPPFCGKVLVLGGRWASDGPKGLNAAIYDPKANSWHRASSPIGLPAHAVGLSKGNCGRRCGMVLAFGGSDHPGSSDAQLYNPLKNTWVPASRMQVARSDQTSGVLLDDGRVLVAGGKVRDPQTGSPPAINGAAMAHAASVEFYDPRKNSWSVPPSPPPIPPSSEVVLSRLLGGGALALGYQKTGNDKTGITVEAFPSHVYYNSALRKNTNPVGTWKAVEQPEKPRLELFHKAALVECGPAAGQVLVAGGWKGLNPQQTSLSPEYVRNLQEGKETADIAELFNPQALSGPASMPRPPRSCKNAPDRAVNDANSVLASPNGLTSRPFQGGSKGFHISALTLGALMLGAGLRKALRGRTKGGSREQGTTRP